MDDENKSNTIDGLGDQPSSSEGLDTAGGPNLQEALATKIEECKALNDRYLRQAAEFENYKRLAQRDQREQIRFGNEQLLKELLPVIDNLERALKSAKDNGGGGAVLQGVDLTLKQMTAALAKFGVQPVATVGQPFDPTTHQAVSHAASDTVATGHVAEEFQKGYRLHDRVLRPAMVSVSSGPGSAEPEATA